MKLTGLCNLEAAPIVFPFADDSVQIFTADIKTQLDSDRLLNEADNVEKKILQVREETLKPDVDVKKVPIIQNIHKMTFNFFPRHNGLYFQQLSWRKYW